MHVKYILTFLVFYIHGRICTRKKKTSHKLGHNAHHTLVGCFGLSQELESNHMDLNVLHRHLGIIN